MASSRGRGGTRIRGVQKEMMEVDTYQIFHIRLADTCYIDKDNLRVFETGVFEGKCKKADGQIIQVNMLPNNFWAMQAHSDLVEFYRRLGLARYFSLPPWGIDVKRAWQLMTTIGEDGMAQIEDMQNNMITVHITRSLIAEALYMPTGNMSLTAKLAPKDIQQKFLNIKEHTFKELAEKECEFPLRIFVQHFQLGRPTCYTHPHTRVAHAFSKAAEVKQSRMISADFAEYVFTEMVSFAKKKRFLSKPLMNGGHFLTRLAYYALGEIDQLPAAYQIEDLLLKANPDVKPMRGRLAKPKPQGKPKSPEEAEGAKESDDEETTEEGSDYNEDSESDPEKEHPAHSEIRERYEQLAAQVERRTKRRAEGAKSPEKRPAPVQPKEDPRVVKARMERMQEQAVASSLMEVEERRILTKLGKRPAGNTSAATEAQAEE